MAKRAREDAEWWLAASIDDYESAQLLFKGGKYSKTVHVLHNATEKALKAAILDERKRPPYGGRPQPRPSLRDGSVEAQTIREIGEDDRRFIASILTIRISGRGTRGSWDTVQKGASPKIP